jgi:hypothetical protein
MRLLKRPRLYQLRARSDHFDRKWRPSRERLRHLFIMPTGPTGVVLYGWEVYVHDSKSVMLSPALKQHNASPQTTPSRDRYILIRQARFRQARGIGSSLSLVAALSFIWVILCIRKDPEAPVHSFLSQFWAVQIARSFDFPFQWSTMRYHMGLIAHSTLVARLTCRANQLTATPT